jgi:hypothetical protein
VNIIKVSGAISIVFIVLIFSLILLLIKMVESGTTANPVGAQKLPYEEVF